MRSPKTILITGASSGIGEALALQYSAPGIRLALTGRSSGRLGEVAAACRAKGAEVSPSVVDVRDAAAMREWTEAEDDKTAVDLVIANAGVLPESGYSDDEARLRAVIETNIGGVINTVQPALDRMRARRRGQVAIMSSLASFKGTRTSVAYSMSKAAVRFYGEALRGEVRRDGVQVSVICPGYVRSRMTEESSHSIPSLMESDRAAHIIQHGLARNRARNAFPFPAYARVWFLSMLPALLSDGLSRAVSARAKRAPG